MLAVVDNVARVIAIAAVVVAALAARGTWAQAHGQRAAVAPKVTASTANSGEWGTVKLTFETNLRIRKVVVKVRSHSAVIALGKPGAVDPTRKRVVFHDISSKGDVQVPATFLPEATYNQPARFRVTMHGHGFGKVSVNVDAPSHNVFAY